MQNPNPQTKIDESELEIHRAVMQWVRLHKTISPYIIHIPNEGKRTASYGMLLKELGMRAGVSDLFIAIPRHQYNGAWIELKTAKGRLSIKQLAFLNDMRAQGYHTVICRSVDDAIETIKWYCFA